ncbi:hypothetical protein SEPCBS57363_000158 [Sporothrix epigloea]|uniref:F-box domain-containing protein n=1 Tax=Sporothrix epigloea TaxID=1892477 RepID=A0ABP0D4N2_9PEZI
MDALQAQQPDEGYSEDPLSSSGSAAVSSKTAAGDAASGLLPVISRHISSLSLAAKIELTEALLQSLPTSAIVEIVEKLSPRLYIDFIRYLPAEICLNILGYLDPLSLIAVARSCRAWYSLSMDRKLWQRLYYLEGWKTVASELQRCEELVNRDRPVTYDGGHVSKRRAISSSRRPNDDRDHVMLDTDRHWRTDSMTMALSQDSMTLSPLQSKDVNNPSAFTSFASSSSSSRKGKQRAVSPAASATTTGLQKPMLWVWDPVGARYHINWKHLYTLRRRLEANWELGKYTNFQFPHPEHLNEAHGECIYTIQFDADYLVSGSRDRTMRIWSLETRRLVRLPLVGHHGSVLCLQFDSDPEQDLIVSGSSDSSVILWRFSTGAVIQRLHRAHREPVLNVKFDKNILVTCSKDKTIKVFNRRPLNPGDLGYGSGEEGEAVDPVGIPIKRYGFDDISHLPVKPPYSLIGTLEGHSAAVNAVQIFGREIISASGDRNVKIWDWPKEQCIRTLVGHSKGIACVQYDGRRIVSGSSDNEVKVFDRRTSLEVASLRRHSNLVRTVQAGFGDLPYSIDEDEKAASRLDQQYIEAVHNGTLPRNVMPSQRRRRRQGGDGLPASGNGDMDGENGMLRPENIRFTGAKVPPGGGGGRYGRIVSGSYDTTIIIWRQDKHGVWKDQHHLKQEEAAAAAAAAAADAAALAATNRQRAARRAAASARNERFGASSQPFSPTTIDALQSQQQQQHQQQPQDATQQSENQASVTMPTPATTQHQQQPAPPSGSAMHLDLPDVGGSVAPAADTRYAVPAVDLDELAYRSIEQGVHALQVALSLYPALLEMQPVLQEAIRRQPSSHVRSQMRQTVSAALVRAQLAPTAGIVPPPPPPPLTPAEAAAIPDQQQPWSNDAPSGAAGMPPTTATAQPPTATVNHQQMPVPPAHTTAPPATVATAAAAVGPNTQAPVAVGPPPLYPQMRPGDGQASAARVFKLQFDARRIICCSQTAVIVGWDFCNGDPELEEAARFFATVE